MSYLVADYPEIEELDINPLLVGPQEVIALDARIVIDREMIDREVARYSHLALHPYPEEFVNKINLNDNTPVLLRPIKPEDEPLWLEMLGNCSKESLYFRFRHFFHWHSHEVASRFCYIDYDREIAIVAEIENNGKRELIGIGRLIADPGYENIEYAILIPDAWQNRDLGNLLTDYCIDIARQWDPQRIIAQTTTDNPRMIKVFEKRGFSISIEDGQVDVSLELK
jgi:acetyltransferase